MNKVFSLPIKNINVLETNQSDFKKIEIWAISDGVNRNESEFTFESLETALPTIWGKPIVGYFSPKTKNFEEHNIKLISDPKTGDFYRDLTESDSEYPMGFVNESKDIVEIREQDGKKWIYFTAHLWSKLNKEAIENLLQSKRKKTSAEVTVLESHMDDKGIEIIDSFIFDAICILGNHRGGSRIPVEEGIEGSHLKILENSDMIQNFKRVINFALNNVEDIQTKEGENVFYGLTANQLRSRIYSELSQYKVVDGESEWRRYSIDDFSDSVVYINDWEDNKYYQISYKFEDNNIILDMESKTEVEPTYKPITFAQKEEIFIDKDSIGTGEAIKINSTKEAVSTKSWGEVNKTALRNTLLKASNYKAAINKCYIIKDADWENAPSEKLHYPVMCIENDELVYSKTGLIAAYQMASKEKDEVVIKKVMAIRKKLGLLEEEEKHMQYISKKDGEKMTIKETVEKDKRFVYTAECDSKALCFDIENKKMVLIPFTKSEDDEHIEMNVDGLKAVTILATTDDEDNQETYELGDSINETIGCMSSAEVEMNAQITQLATDKESLETQCKTLSLDKEKADSKIREYIEKEMTDELEMFAQSNPLTADEKKEFSDKIKEFSDAKEFKKEMVFAYHEKHESKDGKKHFTMGNILGDNTTKKVTPFDKIKNI